MRKLKLDLDRSDDPPCVRGGVAGHQDNGGVPEFGDRSIMPRSGLVGMDAPYAAPEGGQAVEEQPKSSAVDPSTITNEDDAAEFVGNALVGYAMVGGHAPGLNVERSGNTVRLSFQDGPAWVLYVEEFEPHE